MKLKKRYKFIAIIEIVINKRYINTRIVVI